MKIKHVFDITLKKTSTTSVILKLFESYTILAMFFIPQLDYNTRTARTAYRIYSSTQDRSQNMAALSVNDDIQKKKASVFLWETLYDTLSTWEPFLLQVYVGYMCIQASFLVKIPAADGTVHNMAFMYRFLVIVQSTTSCEPP